MNDKNEDEKLKREIIKEFNRVVLSKFCSIGLHHKITINIGSVSLTFCLICGDKFGKEEKNKDNN